MLPILINEMSIHFISIGGSVMHQLAIALKRKGYHITGSDDEIFEPSRTNLQQESILPSQMGWHPELIHKDLEAVILGMHARADNPELLKAKELGLKVYSFPEYIYEQSQDKVRIAIGGSHGKTSTTSMIMHVLRQLGRSFDYLVGARLEGFGQSVNITDAPVIVCEADEYPASAVEKRPKFHFLFPQIAVITGIAWDHINVFPTFENYLDQFKIFIEKIESEGVLIYNETDEVLTKLIADNVRKDIRYVPYGVPGYAILNGVTNISIGKEKGDLQVFGNHNLLNINASYNVCKELKVTDREFINSIGSFKGAAKRLEVLAHDAGTTIFRDFAHAPSKVKATIEAVRQQYPNRKLIALFELHTYSSLSTEFLPQYQGVLDPADEACVFYSLHAMEIKRMPPLKKETVAEGFAKAGLKVITEKDELENWLLERDLTNACLLLMSSGTYDGLDLKKIADNFFA